MKILSASTLLDSIMVGATIVLARVGQTEVLVDVDEEEVVVLVPGPPVVPAAHVCFITAVLFNVTAPFLAKSLPLTVELPLSVIDVKASTFPLRAVEVPRVAEEPTCQ